MAKILKILILVDVLKTNMLFTKFGKKFLSKGISFHPSGDVHVAGRGEDGRYE
jgi:hypothetical protein